jgi:predicted transposase YbfD/YdcC
LLDHQSSLTGGPVFGVHYTLARTPVAQDGQDKTNEHKTALRLLEDVVLDGRLVTGDAISCRRDLSRRIIDADGHYFRFVKENQPTPLHDVQTAFAASVEADLPP